MSDTEKRIREILNGINQEEGYTDAGWWETSGGAAFGAKKLQEVLDVVHTTIPRSALPGLPEGWTGPFEVVKDENSFVGPRFVIYGRCLCANGNYRPVPFAFFHDQPQADFNNALLNACYGEGE